MSIVIDANMAMFANRLNIPAVRMVEDYGLKTVDEIIEAEAAQGNTKAINYAREMYDSPEKLMKIFQLADVENKFKILQEMDKYTREKVLPLLEKEDLIMGLYFFNQDKLLEMLREVDIEELINVILDAFPFQQIIEMIPEENLQAVLVSGETTLSVQDATLIQQYLAELLERFPAEEKQEGIHMTINNTPVKVDWENNEAVAA